jgi:hypothetical protein
MMDRQTLERILTSETDLELPTAAMCRANRQKAQHSVRMSRTIQVCALRVQTY